MHSIHLAYEFGSHIVTAITNIEPNGGSNGLSIGDELLEVCKRFASFMCAWHWPNSERSELLTRLVTCAQLSMCGMSSYAPSIYHPYRMVYYPSSRHSLSALSLDLVQFSSIIAVFLCLCCCSTISVQRRQLTRLCVLIFRWKATR